MKILIVNTLYYPYRVGGAEISVQVLAENLVKKGLKVAVLTLGEKEEKFFMNGVQVWRLKMQNIYWPFDSLKRNAFQKLFWHYNDRFNTRYFQKVLKIFDEFSPDLVHTNNLLGFSVAIWDLASQRKIKIVHTLRDYYLQCVRTTRFKGSSTCYRQCFECRFLTDNKKRISQQVNTVVGISYSILDNHRKEGYFNNANHMVIYNGFEASGFLGKPFKFDQNSPIHFGYIGQISQAKGIELLVDALSKLDSSKNWDLTIAGKVDEEIKKDYGRILPAEKINFMGFVNPVDFYRTINVLVVPSIWEEPFGRVVIEALSNKIVVLGSRVGGISEILNNHQNFTFEPNNDSLGFLLNSIVNDPEILNGYCIESANVERFSLKKLINDYNNLYARILS